MKKRRKILIYLCFIEVFLAFFHSAQAIESHAVVLMYHRFDESKYPSTNIQAEQFVAQLDFLEENDFQVWSVRKIIHHLKSRLPIPDKTVGITIDDAYASVYQVAYPIFKKRKLPFTVFVSTDSIDNKNPGYMSWAELREMVSSGVEIGNHSRTHEHFVNRKLHEKEIDWLQRIEKNVSYAGDRIKKELKVKLDFFAYPYGEYNLLLASLMENLGYVSFGQHSGAIGELNNMNFLPRYPLSESYANIDNFKDKVLSLPLPVINVDPLEVVTQSVKPLLELELDVTKVKNRNLQCYAAGQGLLNVLRRDDGKYSVQAMKPFTTRRSRYNCTLPISGRYYWYSHLWVRADVDELAH